MHFNKMKFVLVIVNSLNTTAAGIQEMIDWCLVFNAVSTVFQL